MSEQGEFLSEEGAAASPEEEFRKKAVQLYLRTGSLAQVARELNTTVYEVNKVAKTQEWADEIALHRRTELAVLDTALTSILDKTTLELIRRLDYGEEVYDQNGDMHMKPVSAATLTKIVSTVFDKRQLLRGLPTALNNESSKLTELAEKLEQLGRFQNARTIEMQPDESGADPDHYPVGPTDASIS